MTLVRKISLLMHERVQEPSDDIMLQYDAATRLVKKYLGTKVELILPGRSSDAQTEAKPTKVDVIHFLASILTSDLWSTRNARFWEIMKKEKMDEVLFPTNLKDGTQPPMTRSINEGLHLVQQKLKVDSDSKHSLPARGKAVYTIANEDEDVPEEEIGDNFTDEKFELFQDSVYKGLKNAHVHELAVTLNSKQMRTLRARNKRIFQRDSAMRKCGRDKCKTPESCYIYRRGKQMTGRTMYITWSCGSGRRPPKQKETFKKNVNTAAVEFKSNDSSVKMIPVKDRKEITLVHNSEKNGLRIASQFDKFDPYLPKFVAQLGGTEQIGKKVNQLLAIPVENAPKVAAISIVSSQKTEEWNDSLQVIYDHKGKPVNKDENGFKIKTKDPKEAGGNSTNAATNVEKLSKGSNKHLKEETEAKPTQHGRMSLSKRRRIRDEINKFNLNLAETAEDEVGGIDKRVIDRIKTSGFEMHDKLNISDYKQYYEAINNHQGNPGEFSWQNVDWIMSSRTTLTPTQKLEQISTAI